MLGRLNTSVLTRMPRDCTAFPGSLVSYRCTVHSRIGVDPVHNTHELSSLKKLSLLLFDLAMKNTKQNKAKPSNGGRVGKGSALVASSSSGGRVSTKSLLNHPIFGGKLTSNTDSVPSAFVNILGNSTYFSEGSKVLMPELGMDPINLVGSQPLSDVTGAVATPDVFTNNTLATAVSANLIGLSPDLLNGPVAARANLYDKFVFRDVLIEYVSTCATTQASALAVALLEDGSGLGSPTSFSTVRQCVPSISFPLRTDRCFLHYHYRGPQLFYNTDDTATNPGLRLTRQGFICSYASANLTVISPGFFNIYYSLDLYDPVLSQGFTLSVKRQERQVLKDILTYSRSLSSDKATEFLESILKTPSPPRPWAK